MSVSSAGVPLWDGNYAHELYGESETQTLDEGERANVADANPDVVKQLFRQLQHSDAFTTTSELVAAEKGWNASDVQPVNASDAQPVPARR